MTLPANQAIKELFEGLLGRDVTISPGTPVDVTAVPGPTTAAYVDDSLTLATVALMDFRLTAYVGGALGLIPKGGIDDAIDEGQISPDLQENAAEVLNVLAAPLGDASGVHQRLYQTFGPGQDRPDDVAARSVLTGARCDLTIEVKGYGAGTLSLVDVLLAAG